MHRIVDVSLVGCVQLHLSTQSKLVGSSGLLLKRPKLKATIVDSISFF